MPAFLKGFLYSIGFLTVLPVRIPGELKHYPYMSAAFPLVGLVIGLILAGAGIVLAYLNAPLASAVILICLWIGLTGGLHLDGLADTADGLAAGFSSEKTLKVMADHTNGTFAVISIVLTILFKVSVLSALTGSQSMALLVAPVLGRWSVTLTLFLSKYPEKDGLAKPFFSETKGRSLFAATVIAFAISFVVLQSKEAAIIVMILNYFVTFLLLQYFESRIGGNTGDTLGAIVEINEAAILLMFLLAVSVAL